MPNSTLEIFAESNGERYVHKRLEGLEAYDTWHLSYYYKEILENRKLLKKDKKIELDQLRRKDRDIFTYIVLTNFANLSGYIELGSSLFEIFDGLKLVDKYLKGLEEQEDNDSHAIEGVMKKKFIGIESSELMRHAAEDLNHQHKLLQYKSEQEFRSKEKNGEKLYLYDRAVAGYAFKTVDEYARFLSRFEIGFGCFSLTKGRTFQASRLHNQFTYFSIPELIDKLPKRLWYVFGNKAPKKPGPEDPEGNFFDCFCIYGDYEQAKTILDKVSIKFGSYYESERMSLKPIEILTA